MLVDGHTQKGGNTLENIPINFATLELKKCSGWMDQGGKGIFRNAYSNQKDDALNFYPVFSKCRQLNQLSVRF